jgi:hypothetical protein
MGIHVETVMAAIEIITLPSEKYRLEEINLSGQLAESLAGKTVPIEAVPEVMPMTRQLEANDRPAGGSFWIDTDGEMWNRYSRARVRFSDPEGCKWHLPRHWLTTGGTPLKEEAPYRVTQEMVWTEELHLPSMWDLSDINIEMGAASAAAGEPTAIEVRAAPNQQVRVLWRDSSGKAWRIPHDWRRRRIRLPDYDLLLENGVPPDVAEEFAGKAVSVNYHPGSLCCLPDGYRFRDGYGGRWPIRAIDCLLLGYGDRDERQA